MCNCQFRSFNNLTSLCSQCDGLIVIYDGIGGYLITGANDNIYLTRPADSKISQNYPNLFNPSTRINFHISEARFTSLKVYNVFGNEISTLDNEEKPVGTYELKWNANKLSSGVYFYQLKAGDFVQTMKMVLLK